MESDHDNMNIRVASFACYLDGAKENLVHRVSAQDPLNSSPNSIKPPLTIKFSKSKDNHHHHHQTQDQHNLTNLRVDSFSNYLNSGPIQDPTSAFTFTHEIPKDGEISVFGADKYFNMKLEYQTRHEKILKQKYLETEGAPNVNILPKVVTPKATTPSLCSEASSNTQAALFTNNIQKINVGSSQNHQKIPKKSIFTGFGCRGRPCFDKKSVHINEIVARSGSERIIKDIIPAVLNPTSIDASRPSIEVFGSSNTTSKAGDHNHSIVAANMERKLSILTWDAIPKGQKNNINPQSSPTVVASSTNICDDMASEASSDLFEIENISGSIFPLLSSEPGDDMSACMSPTSNYAPSEASIQWSVVTASAAPDYSSVVSDYNDEASVSVAGDIVMMRNKCNNNVKGAKRADEKGQQKGRTGGLLGCKSHKAVDVAETYKPFGKSQASRGRVKDLEMLQYPSIH